MILLGILLEIFWASPFGKEVKTRSTKSHLILATLEIFGNLLPAKDLSKEFIILESQRLKN